MNKKQLYNEGFERGRNIASWQDLPEIGIEVKPYELEGFEGPIETLEDAEEAFLSICFEAEDNNRCFTPFEFTCKALNALAGTKPYDVWEIFETGMYKGFQDNWESRKSYYSE